MSPHCSVHVPHGVLGPAEGEFRCCSCTGTSPRYEAAESRLSLFLANPLGSAARQFYIHFKLAHLSDARLFGCAALTCPRRLLALEKAAAQFRPRQSWDFRVIPEDPLNPQTLGRSNAGRLPGARPRRRWPGMGPRRAAGRLSADSRPCSWREAPAGGSRRVRAGREAGADRRWGRGIR